MSTDELVEEARLEWVTERGLPEEEFSMEAIARLWEQEELEEFQESSLTVPTKSGIAPQSLALFHRCTKHAEAWVNLGRGA